MDSDEVFYKGGVDVFVFGHARAPEGEPVAEMQVRVSVGAWSRAVRVIGNRVWQRRGARLEAGPPAPFVEMPLGLSHAYGGVSEWDALPNPYPANPDGKGFFIEEEQAEGGALPNLEELDAPIAAWTDRPAPAGLGPCPLQSPLRLMNGIGFDDKGLIVKVRPTLFNAAFPRMIAPAVAPGARVVVEGVRADGPVEFRLPDQLPRVRLTFEPEVIEQTLAIDQIGIEADLNRVVVAYRYPFRYVIYPMQRRSCELFVPDGAVRGGPAR
jgi:hypothetical protein